MMDNNNMNDGPLLQISGHNANVKMPTPKTPMHKMLPPIPKPQPPNTKVRGISYIGVLSVAFRPDTNNA